MDSDGCLSDVSSVLVLYWFLYIGLFVFSRFSCGCCIVWGGRSEIVIGGFGEIIHEVDVARNFLGNRDFGQLWGGLTQKYWEIIQHKRLGVGALELPANVGFP